jgi:hypothetical protein
MKPNEDEGKKFQVHIQGSWVGSFSMLTDALQHIQNLIEDSVLNLDADSMEISIKKA